MSFDLNEYFRAHHDRRADFRSAPKIVCADGLTLSVQASRYHYCAPRDSDGPWYKVEVGFPSAVCPELMEWCESPEMPMETAYGYVPVDVVERLIDAHGGVTNERDTNQREARVVGGQGTDRNGRPESVVGVAAQEPEKPE